MKCFLRAFASVAALFLILAGCSRTPTVYVATGNKLFDEGKFDDAALNYRKAIQGDPKYAEAYYRLGLVSLKKSKPQEALAFFTLAVDSDSTHTAARDQLTDIALTAYLQSQDRPRTLHDRLVKLESEYFAKDPNSYNGYRIRGFLALTDRRLGDAQKSFEQALQLKPGDIETTLGLFTSLTGQQQFPRAEQVVREALAKTPDSEQLAAALYLLLNGLNRFDDAAKLLLSQVERRPNDLEAALKLARHYAGQKQYDRVNEVVQRILDRPQNYPEGRLKVIDFYTTQGNWKEAASQIDIGLKVDPSRKDAYERERLRALVLQGQGENALRVSNELLAANPKDEVVLHARATMLLKPGTLPQSRRDLENLVAMAPANPVYKFKLGRAHHLLGDLDRARELYAESARLRRTYLPPRLALAEMSFDEKRYKQSVELLNQVLAVDPSQHGIRVMLAAGLMGLGDNARAESEVSSVLRAFPSFPPAEIQLAYLRLNAKRYSEARALFQKYASRDPRALRGLTEVYLSEGNPAGALALVSAEARKRPDDPALDDLMSEIAVRSGRYDAAIQSFSKVLARSPDSAVQHAKMGELYRLAGDTAKAVTHLEKAASLDPSQPGPFVALGFLHSSSGRSAEARRAYEQGLKLRPNDPVILNNLALLLTTLDTDLDRALDYAKRALAQRPNDPSFRDTVGWVYARSKNTPLALQIFERLIQSHPNNATYRYHYAFALLQSGDKAKAKTQLDAALTRKPAKDEEAEIRKLLATLG